MKLTAQNWSAFSAAISYPKEPEEYYAPAVEKLMTVLSPYVVHMKNVRPQFHAENSISIIGFRDAESRKRYDAAYENFLAMKAKLQAKEDAGGGGMGMMILVQLLMFRKAAEEEKVEDIVDAMWDSYNNNEAPVASFNFKYSIAKAVKLLNTKYGVSRDNISLIWGGGNTVISEAKKKKLALKAKLAANDKLRELFQEINMDDFDLGIAGVEEAKIVDDDEDMRLGAQSLKERQKEIDRFQSGKTQFCFFTLKAGGVGLSLHHSDELTKEKVRRHKDSGWAVVEDIKNIPIRPRRLFGATTYSAIELVQMLGRCPRLSSLSNTPQTIIFYRGTIEERVAYIVSAKLKCLRKVVSQKESWEEVILGGIKKEDGGNLGAEKDITSGQNTILQIENGEDSMESIESDVENEDDDEYGKQARL